MNDLGAPDHGASLKRAHASAVDAFVPIIALVVGIVFLAALSRLPTRYNDHFAIPMTIVLIGLAFLQFARVLINRWRTVRTTERGGFALGIAHSLRAPELHFAALVVIYVSAFSSIPFVPLSVVFLVLAATVLTAGSRREALRDAKWWGVAGASSLALYYGLRALSVPLTGF